LNGNTLSNAQAFVPTEPRADRAEASAQFSRPIAAQAATMPARIPQGSRNIAGYWVPKGETLIHIFIGPDKRLMGAFRVCGIDLDVQRSLIMSKNRNTHRVEVWFKDLCTVREYERLCESSVSARSRDVSLIYC
jgi:chromo domain-containing protein 1